MSELIFRHLRPADAQALSSLFREIYGDHYVQPDVYLPSMISAHNATGRWQSMVAVNGGKLLGHAALCRESHSTQTAELALTVVHPAARGLRIATRLARQLLAYSPSLGLRSLVIKQVTHHPYTQRMATSVGFHNTGFLPDYVPSPFAEQLTESVVVGVYLNDRQTRPLPDIAWPDSCAAFLRHLCSVFGTHKAQSALASQPLQIRQTHGRIDIVVARMSARLLEQLHRLPEHWLISLRLRLSVHFAEDLHSLSGLAFSFTGLMPTAEDDVWFALFHRGCRTRSLSLNCAYMQQLHDVTQRISEDHPVLHGGSTAALTSA